MERKYNFRQCRNGLWKGLGDAHPESWDLRDLLWKKEKGMEKGKNYGKGCRPQVKHVYVKSNKSFI